jgi:cytochrome P450
MLMAVRDEDGSAMTRMQLRDEAVTLLLAGHETTAIALSWTWYLLARHPEIDEQVGREARAAADGRPLTAADLGSLPLTERAINESLRLYPPAYTIGREAVRDCEVAGVPVRTGTTLFISPWVVHRDARWFDDPDRFDPDRWDGDLARRLPKYAYMPFGGGPRLCIGNRFALMEAVLLLATIARRYRFTTLDPTPPVPFPTVTLRPRDGVPVVLERRSA